jgi:hypothetical protein
MGLQRALPAAILASCLLLGAPVLLVAAPDRPAWPLTLREGLPATLPGYAAAPTESLPDESENEMGAYVEVSRFFQRIESATSTKQFRLVIQDYGSGKDLLAALRKAFAEAKQAGVEARELEISGHKTFAVTDRSSGRPTTLVTVIVTPSRLVLGQGANVPGDEALQLVKSVDFARVRAVKKGGS